MYEQEYRTNSNAAYAHTSYSFYYRSIARKRLLDDKRIKNREADILLFFDRFGDRIYKKIIIIFLLFFPMLEVIWNEYIALVLWDGQSIYSPLYMTFLSGSSIMVGKSFQIVYLWILPVYLLLATCDDVATDLSTGFRTALISRMGRKKYFWKNLFHSFLRGFGLIFTALAINLIQVCVLFRGGDYSRFDGTAENEANFFTFSLHHPLGINLVYILLAALLAGAVSAAGCSLLFVLKERVKVYPVIIIAWLFAVLWDPSLMLAAQPFSEESALRVLSVFLVTLGIYILFILAGIGKEIWFEKRQAN